MALPQPGHWNSQSYLAFDRDNDVKHEFFGVEPLAMSGASREHNLLVGNLVTNLNLSLRGSPCETYPSDMRVEVTAIGSYTYPDVIVVCEEPDFLDDHFDTLTNPTVLFEVLSPSTETTDRGVKLRAYREIPSVQEYVLVSQTETRIEHYSRQDDGSWRLDDHIGQEAVLQLRSVNVEPPLALIYERIQFKDAEAQDD